MYENVYIHVREKERNEESERKKLMNRRI